MNLYYVILFLVSPELHSCTEVLKVGIFYDPSLILSKWNISNEIEAIKDKLTATVYASLLSEEYTILPTYQFNTIEFSLDAKVERQAMVNEVSPQVSTGILDLFGEFRMSDLRNYTY
ncbi:hypothetical protein CLF_105210 [Clonorchis sinensis]|uniref:Uncharacterized protein n=1 Tax=Clonorchis sinensis TaxID=79923 RepID=G7YD75_CLOSI|nr:hypothetical protein CLF_105210 [Clonorchis sinensis]